jgi:hypothetical protein
MSLEDIFNGKAIEEETEKQKRDRLKAREKYFNRVKDAFIKEQHNPNMILILKFLYSFCEYDSITDVTKNSQTGEVSTITTLYNSTLRSVYARLRVFMPKALKLHVEFED